MSTPAKDLSSRYAYSTRYVPDVAALRRAIRAKTVIPYQVEVQPGPEPGRPLCWLRCPYCYGNTARDTGERLSHERYRTILRQIAEGGVKKIIFAGYATDPLNYGGIDDLLEIAVEHGQVFGFHTKALKVSDRFLELVSRSDIAETSYISISVDAGGNDTYNRVHGLEGSTAKLYDQVLATCARIAEARAKTQAPFDLSATYLLNGFNHATEEVVRFVEDFRAAGADLVRFTFPQAPRGYDPAMDPFIPSKEQVAEMMERLAPVLRGMDGAEGCQVLLMDLDAQQGTFRKDRTLPCYARFVFPCIGFDGWLGHCSEGAAPHFREMAMGNLGERDFWDVFYDYDPERIDDCLARAGAAMTKLGCKCDRKEHAVNEAVGGGGRFDG